MFKSGFVNIIGYPNAGKSTLINSFLNDKLSIITEKAQTTRHKILGIENTDDYQLIFTDNPGYTKPANIVHEYMNKKVKESIVDGDIILYVVDLSSKSMDYDDLNDKLKKIKVPLMIVRGRFTIHFVPYAIILLYFILCTVLIQYILVLMQLHCRRP